MSKTWKSFFFNAHNSFTTAAVLFSQNTIFFFQLKKYTEFIASNKNKIIFSLSRNWRTVRGVRWRRFSVFVLCRIGDVRMWLRRLFDVKWSDSSNWMLFYRENRRKNNPLLVSLSMYGCVSAYILYRMNELKNMNVFCGFSAHTQSTSFMPSDVFASCAVIKIGTFGCAQFRFVYTQRSLTGAYLFERRMWKTLNWIWVTNVHRYHSIVRGEAATKSTNISEIRFNVYHFELKSIQLKLCVILCISKTHFLFCLCRPRCGALLVANAHEKKKYKIKIK